MKLVKGSPAKAVLRYGPGNQPDGKIVTQFGANSVQFWDNTVAGGVVELILLFVPPDKVKPTDGVRRFLPAGTDLHRAYLSVMAGEPPEPFFDYLMETGMPELESLNLIGKYVNGVSE